MDIETKICNSLRVMSVNAIEKANSGHPGVCLGAAPVLFSIYKMANVHPQYPNSIFRDRVVLSAGHASALLYSTLSLFNFDISIADLKNFRQLNSKTPGHPEVKVTDGVDVSTGPLGQGIANAVGLAISQTMHAGQFNKLNYDIFNSYTYCFCGDGCLMEGVAWEAISIAGHLKLNKLILLYDKNDITIEGSLNITNSEDTSQKFKSCNWQVLNVADANDIQAICNNIAIAKQSKSKPTVIIINSQIGFGSELAGTSKVHGSPLNKQQIEVLKQKLNYAEPDWQFAEDVKTYISTINAKNQAHFENYSKKLKEYFKAYPEQKQKYHQYFDGGSVNLAPLVAEIVQNKSSNSTRNLSHLVLNKLTKIVPNMVGGSADLAPSTMLYFDDGGYYSSTNTSAKNIHFGVREHAMGSICNGMMLFGGLKVFCSSFFTFENYMTPSIRMSALMGLPIIFGFSHDSFAVGEDGPTHQPVEQIATLRAMPNINVFRPCGVCEVLAAFEVALNGSKPTAIITTRQKLNVVEDDYQKAKMGGYLLKENSNATITLLACGSEVPLAVEVEKLLKEKGIIVNIASMPCLELFDKNSSEYKEKVIKKSTKIFAIEASSDNIWHKYLLDENYLFNIKEFTKSGKAEQLNEYYGFTSQQIINRILNLIN